MAFSDKDDQVAFYDFQYVGRGLGVQDLSKFLTTSVEEDLLDDNGEVDLLKEYHEAFLKALIKRGDFEEEEVAEVYPFEQFLEDWKLAIVSVSTTMDSFDRRKQQFVLLTLTHNLLSERSGRDSKQDGDSGVTSVG